MNTNQSTGAELAQNLAQTAENGRETLLEGSSIPAMHQAELGLPDCGVCGARPRIGYFDGAFGQRDYAVRCDACGMQTPRCRVLVTAVATWLRMGQLAKPVKDEAMEPMGSVKLAAGKGNGATETAAPPITSANVRVMRSHDYCHFEVSLGSDGRGEKVPGLPQVVRIFGPEEVDALRKEAARLADKAVAQFILAKRIEGDRSNGKWERDRLMDKARDIEARIAEGERTPQQKAIVKLARDEAYWARRSRRYDYEDYWDDDDADLRVVLDTLAVGFEAEALDTQAAAGADLPL